MSNEFIQETVYWYNATLKYRTMNMTAPDTYEFDMSQKLGDVIWVKMPPNTYTSEFPKRKVTRIVSL